jgi:2-polyprenyl-6-methoxyphenol hydroxylase-like FAD-dependent oxidoreductase
VGINLAVQDAVATANLLFSPLRSGSPSFSQLQAIQRRREWPTKMTQAVQVFIQNNILARSMSRAAQNEDLPLALKILRHSTFLRRIPPRIFGMGFRPEHVHPALRAKIPG